MIKNFNFYDVYGYLIPGLAVLGVFWIPFGLATARWPAPEWSSALIVVVLGYIAGHVLQTFTHMALPDRFAGRYPSDRLLDATDKRFSDEFKDLLCKKINRVFGLEAKYDAGIGNAGAGAVMKNRGIAFFLCRSALMQCRAGAYAEQAQGMYVLTRGLSAAFALGAVLHFGWVAGSVCETKWAQPITAELLAGVAALGAVIAAVVLALRELHQAEEKKNRPQIGSAVSLLTAVFLLGVVLGHNYPGFQERGATAEAAQDQQSCCVKITDVCCCENTASGGVIHKANSEIANSVPLKGWLLGLVFAEILFSIKLYDGFKRFANIFAESVYRDFLVLDTCGKTGDAHATAPEEVNEE
jgi:hypothetical protein